MLVTLANNILLQSFNWPRLHQCFTFRLRTKMALFAFTFDEFWTSELMRILTSFVTSLVLLDKLIGSSQKLYEICILGQGIPYWILQVAQIWIVKPDPPCQWSALSELSFCHQLRLLFCDYLHFNVSYIVSYWLVWMKTVPDPSLLSTRHPSYGDCLEVKREYYQNCSVLGCVTQCSQSAAHSYEQFLQVQQIRFVASGPLRHA